MLQRSILPRVPVIDPPERCDNRKMKAQLSRAAAAFLDGVYDQALSIYTEISRLAPEWDELGIMRGLVLEAMDEPSAAQVLAPYQNKLAAMPAWSAESRAKAWREVESCVQEANDYADEWMRKGTAGFDASRCGRLQ